MLRRILVHTACILPTIAAGVVALLYASDIVASISLTVTLLWLLTCVGLAFGLRGSARAFLVGFAIVGGAYFFLRQSFETELATTRISTWVYDTHFAPPDDGPLPSMDIPVRTLLRLSLRRIEANEILRAQFVVISECLWSLLLGYLGGCMALIVSGRGPSESTLEKD